MLQSLTSVIKLNSQEHKINCKQPTSHFLFILFSQFETKIIAQRLSENIRMLVGMAIIGHVSTVMLPEIDRKTNRKCVMMVKVERNLITRSIAPFPTAYRPFIY